jgi:DNA-binding NtrC family response regulator
MASDALPLKEQLRYLEDKIIADAIRKYGNARRQPCSFGINPSTISRKLCKKGMYMVDMDANMQKSSLNDCKIKTYS